MANLYTLAGSGSSPIQSITGGIGNTASSLGGLLSFLKPEIGIPTAIAGGLTSLFGGIFGRQAEEAEGRRRFASAKSEYSKAIADNPFKYSTLGVSNTFDTARSNLEKANTSGTNALLDRYSSLQRKQMRNKITSGLTSGAAQAASVQNNLAFQQQANQLFQQQGTQLSNLALREGQAKQNMVDIIDARKDRLAQRTLAGAGITNPTALQGLTGQITGY